MLWWSSPKQDLSVSIQSGLDYFKDKYGREADTVMINPKSMPVDKTLVGGCFYVGTATVRPYKYILPNNLWIGIEDKE